MSSSAHGSQRPILMSAVRELARAAQSERAVLAMDAPEREFYLGVEAAADEVLHPELATARVAGWPDRESAPFREGYLRTSASLASALGAENPPLHLRLPDAHAAAW
jgi:hypothetical protein